VTADKTAADRFAQAMHQCPLLAVLRGVPAEQAEAMADVLAEAGFAMIEIPLDAPHAIESIERIAARHGNHVLVGAGRVLSVADVDAARSAGATLIAAPNVDPVVIAYAVDTGMVMLPGYFTTAPLPKSPSTVTIRIWSPFDAASSMPFDSTPRMTAGFKFATTMTVFPSRWRAMGSSAGSNLTRSIASRTR